MRLLAPSAAVVSKTLVYGVSKRRPLSVTRFDWSRPAGQRAQRSAERPRGGDLQIGALGGRRAGQSRRSHGRSRAASLTERSLSRGRSPKADSVAGRRPGVWARKSDRRVPPVELADEDGGPPGGLDGRDCFSAR